MTLIQLLQESSSLSLADLKKAMLKDPRAALIFKKDLTLDSIPDKEAFLATMKYYVFNNENVKSFVKMRHNVRDVDTQTFDSFRKMRGPELNEKNLEWLHDFVAAIFKEHNSVSKGTMSSELKKKLAEWFNSNRGYHDLPTWAERELMAIPSLRPDKRVLLYRGILFSEGSLKERESYDGTLEKGNGLKFLQTIRKGGREVDLTWDRPSSWSTSKEIATRFAQYGPATSQFSAMTQWFDRSMNKRAIDGALGYVISTFANPEDILIDTGRFNANINQQHGDEGEVILKKGEYLARVVKKYTVEGEVDPEAPEKIDTDSPASKALVDVASYAKDAELPEQVALTDREDGGGWRRAIYSHEALPVMSDMSKFKKLVLNSTTTAAVHGFDKLFEFYNKALHALQSEDLRADKYVSNDEMRKKVDRLKEFVDMFRHDVSHSKFRNDKNPKGRGKKHELTGEEYRATISPSDIKYIESDLMKHGKLIDRNAGRAFDDLAKYVGVALPSSKFYMMGAPKQVPVIDEVISKFFNSIGVDKPADRTDAIKSMLNLIRKAHRNYIMLEELKSIHNKLGELK